MLSTNIKVVDPQISKQLLNWLFIYSSEKKASPLAMEEINNFPVNLENALKDLERQDFIILTCANDVIIDIKLTNKTQTYFRGKNV